MIFRIFKFKVFFILFLLYTEKWLNLITSYWDQFKSAIASLFNLIENSVSLDGRGRGGLFLSCLGSSQFVCFLLEAILLSETNQPH